MYVLEALSFQTFASTNCLIKLTTYRGVGGFFMQFDANL